MSAITERLTACRCGAELRIGSSTANPYDRSQVVEAVRCPDCRLGGHRVVDAATDRVIRRVGPALDAEPEGVDE